MLTKGLMASTIDSNILADCFAKSFDSPALDFGFLELATVAD